MEQDLTSNAASGQTDGMKNEEAFTNLEEHINHKTFTKVIIDPNFNYIYSKRS